MVSRRSVLLGSTAVFLAVSAPLAAADRIDHDLVTARITCFSEGPATQLGIFPYRETLAGNPFAPYLEQFFRYPEYISPLDGMRAMSERIAFAVIDELRAG